MRICDLCKDVIPDNRVGYRGNLYTALKPQDVPLYCSIKCLQEGNKQTQKTRLSPKKAKRE